MPHGIVYAARAPNGKAYIGQTTARLGARIRQHRYKANRAGAVDNMPFYAALRKYGDKIEWQIIAVCHSQLSLDAAEIAAIEREGTLAPVGYNLRLGGNGGRHSPVAIANMKVAARTRKRPPPQTAESKAKRAASNRGQKRTAEQRANFSRASKHREARKRQRRTGLLL